MANRSVSVLCWTVIFSSCIIQPLLALRLFSYVPHCFDPTSARKCCFLSEPLMLFAENPWSLILSLFLYSAKSPHFSLSYFAFLQKWKSPPRPCITKVASWSGSEPKLGFLWGYSHGSWDWDTPSSSLHSSGDIEVQLPGVLLLGHPIPNLLWSSPHDNMCVCALSPLLDYNLLKMSTASHSICTLQGSW